MGRTGHRLTGISAGVLVACAFWSTYQGIALAAIPCAYFGGTAPDWLEIAHAEYSEKYHRWMRKSVIPHRTITHWWPLWLISTLVAFYGTHGFLQIGLIGFLSGGWMHLLMDIPNPTGIPILTPLAKSRYGFGWWKSGNKVEPFAGFLMVVFSCLCFYWMGHFKF